MAVCGWLVGLGSWLSNRVQCGKAQPRGKHSLHGGVKADSLMVVVWVVELARKHEVMGCNDGVAGHDGWPLFVTHGEAVSREVCGCRLEDKLVLRQMLCQVLDLEPLKEKAGSGVSWEDLVVRQSSPHLSVLAAIGKCGVVAHLLQADDVGVFVSQKVSGVLHAKLVSIPACSGSVQPCGWV